MQENKQTFRVLPVYVVDPQADREKELYIAEELDSLITTLGGTIVERLIQKLDKPNFSTYIGKGKVEELAELVKKSEADVVILNAMAKPGQVHNLKSILQEENPQIEVWDRVDLILQIFEKHAASTEAKLQISLARMRYMGPRIYGMGFVLSRQGGGIGTQGIGETNTELMKRHWRNEIKRTEDQIKKLAKNREHQLERRKRVGYQTISIVGYTNAGKSSLFNALAGGKKVKAEDKLFATLDSTVSKLFFQDLNREVLLTDTIGFIRDLPPKLIHAFRSTLMESVHADVLLHVIDASDPQMIDKITVVEEILGDLGTENKETIYVFNKIDKVSESILSDIKKTYQERITAFTSVKADQGISELLSQIQKLL